MVAHGAPPPALSATVPPDPNYFVLEHASNTRMVSVDLSEAEIVRLVDCLDLITAVAPTLKRHAIAPDECAYRITDTEKWAWAFRREVDRTSLDAGMFAITFRQLQRDLGLVIFP